MVAFIGDVEIGRGENGIYLSKDGVEGWYDTPGLKTDFEERVGAHGAYPARPLYSARTVTVRGHTVFDFDRPSHVAAWESLNAMYRSPQRVRYVDKDDTFITGVVETKFQPEKFDMWSDFEVEVTAADPFRYSMTRQEATLMAGARRGAFDYPVDYPIDYASSDSTASPTGTVLNRGNEVGYPVVTVTTTVPLPGGFLLQDGAGRSIRVAAPVLPGSPVTVDCKRRAVLVGGVNVSWALVERQWFEVPAGGSATVTFQPDADLPVGQAWATLTFRDTWI